MDRPVNRRKFLHGAALTGSPFFLFHWRAMLRAWIFRVRCPGQRMWQTRPPQLFQGLSSILPRSKSPFWTLRSLRLVRLDELGPGAKELGVTVFLDRQMAGPYGNADRWYMQGPFEENADPTFGYQTSHTPAQLYRAGIRGVDAYVMKVAARSFAQLSTGEQDKLLSGLEKGEVKLETSRVEKGKAMAHERLVQRFLNAKHDHIAAYAVERRGCIRCRPDKDLVLLTALAYEVEDFLRGLPSECRTADLRGRLIYDFLRQIPEGSVINRELVVRGRVRRPAPRRRHRLERLSTTCLWQA